MTNYYNEIDPFAAQMLRNLIEAGHIAHGIVDERSIEDVKPSDLNGFIQCHFFAGVGVWSLALRRAGWPDDRPVWTGSCPCQPFSAAGKGDGFADERHLWPAFYHLIAQRRPSDIFGEQVASKAVDAWIDLVHADLEALGYAFGSVPFPSAGVGAPHIRDRNYWAARLGDTSGAALAKRVGLTGIPGWPSGGNEGEAAQRAGIYLGGVGDATGDGREQRGTESGRGSIAAGCTLSGLADPEVRRARREGRTLGSASGQDGGQTWEPWPTCSTYGSIIANSTPGPVNGRWSNADWLFCRDGKWRPVEPSTFPLANGAPARVGRLRAYGNAINAEAARVFIESAIKAAL